ncbi:MAG: hypothetical protein DRN27_04975 [Thermoplasmata archaeon]|nr:MAG: hypothetical protein DRN27_04975 [Thermoplasmata archaeon]
MSFRSVERDIVNGIKIIGLIFALIACFSFIIAFLIAYNSGNVESFIEWFAIWLVDNIQFGVFILLFAMFIGLISPKIARALKDMSGF